MSIKQDLFDFCKHYEDLGLVIVMNTITNKYYIEEKDESYNKLYRKTPVFKYVWSYSRQDWIGSRTFTAKEFYESSHFDYTTLDKIKRKLIHDL